MSMGTENETVNHGGKPSRAQKPDSTPVRSLTTPWLSCRIEGVGGDNPVPGCSDTRPVTGNLGRFYVHVAIVGPIPEQSRYDFSLPCAKAQDIYQAAVDLAKLVEEQSF